MTDAVTARELHALLGGPNPPRLLDVREPEEAEIAQLPASMLVPLGQVPGRLSQLEAWRDEPVVVYCHHGVRSLHAINYLRQAGFTDLRNLTGGIDAWSREVDPAMPRY